MTEAEMRAAVIAEAMTWERTPHHNGAQIKGVGVDCGRYPWAVYHACGLLPPIDDNLKYPPDFFLHSGREWYKSLADKFGHVIETPLPGDFVLYKIGRIYSHGAIIIKWPHIIHAWVRIGVTQDDGTQGQLADRDKIFYSPWKGTP